MKTTAICVFIFMFLCRFAYAQTIPSDRTYLGQIPPERIPERFELSVNPGSFAAERIAISNDGKEIYYTEVKTIILQKGLENQVGFVNRKVDFTIPEDAFLDEDGETTFMYSTTLNTGQPVPEWLSFDKITGRFSGMSAEPSEYTIIVVAADRENAKGLGVFKLIIRDK